MFNPKVSIIVPLYNCEQYIEQCLDSIFAQTYENIEVFCIDNESTDDSYKIIKRLKKEKYESLIIGSVPNIFPFCWEEARDYALAKMTGEYCLIMASDDYLDKDFIKKNMEIFSHAPKKILALQSGIMGVQDGKHLGITKWTYKSIKEMKKQLLERSVVNTPTVIYNRQLYDMGLLSTEPATYSGAADYDMYCKLANEGVMIYPAPDWLGYYYRWHAGQATWGMHKSNIKYDVLIRDYWRNIWRQD